jgi:hypothetical protein
MSASQPGGMTWIEFLPTRTRDGRHIILRGVIVPWRERLRRLLPQR